MRTHRPQVVWIVASAVLLASAVLTAQRATRAKPLSPTAVRKAEQEIDKAAAARGIRLTDAAKQALAKEAMHQEATASAADSRPVTGALSDEKLSKLLTPLADVPPDKQLDVREVETRVVDNKTKQVVAKLPDDIKAHERISGKPVPEDVRLRMTEDLTKQSEALSKSGLAVDAIRLRNEATLNSIDLAIGTGPITTRSYQLAMADIFTRNVQLSILSTPDGADVKVAGFSVGKTNITDKPFKPGWYTFKFLLAGYAEAERQFYVTAGLDSESFTQALTPLSTPGPPPTPGPSPEPKPGPRSGPNPNGGFPWGYAILGGIIVLLLAAVVARRR
jgi:hypothetical protein